MLRWLKFLISSRRQAAANDFLASLTRRSLVSGVASGPHLSFSFSNNGFRRL
jgi:hypothetical protein